MIAQNILGPIQRYSKNINLFQNICKKTSPQVKYGSPVKIILRCKSFSGQTSSLGHGAGKGGGAGGTVRESGGALGEYGAAQEEHYFYNKQKEQLQALQKKMKEQKAEDPSKKTK